MTKDKILEATKEMNEWKRPDKSEMFIGKFYLDYVPSYLFYTVDKIVVEMHGMDVSDEKRKRWVGKHIMDVRDDFKKLHATTIHHEDWRSDLKIQQLLNEHTELTENLAKAKQGIALERKQRRSNEVLIQEYTDWIEKANTVISEIKMKLNKFRADHFGDTNVEDYFKMM